MLAADSGKKKNFLKIWKLITKSYISNSSKFSGKYESPSLDTCTIDSMTLVQINKPKLVHTYMENITN